MNAEGKRDKIKLIIHCGVDNSSLKSIGTADSSWNPKYRKVYELHNCECSSLERMWNKQVRIGEIPKQ